MLPANIQWLNTIGTLPKLVSAALQYLGVKEIKGSANNPVIMDMARGLGLQDIYTSDDTISWCALFINHLIRITGKPPLDPHGDLWNLLRAKYLVNWGHSISLPDALLGDIVVINRDGGGHVFILIAFTKDGNLIGIGGNQSNMVSVGEFDKDRVISIRRYYSISIPESAKRYTIDSTGKLSTNEV